MSTALPVTARPDSAEPMRRPTPLLNKILWLFSRLLFRLIGWRVEGRLPDLPKYVLIGAPHTSNWDFPIALAGVSILTQGLSTVKFTWLGKHTLIQGPFGAFFRWTGGIGVDRTGRHNAVAQAVRLYHSHERFVMLIAPEGTRKKTGYWKTGFYHIALQARVPIVCAFLDFPNKRGGIGPIIYPTGDIQADMEPIRAFYAGFVGKYADQAGDVTIQG